MIRFISTGSIQLLVGPASDSLTLQMKVWSSTRATSSGSLATQMELGFFDSSRRTAVPLSTSTSISFWYSSGEPSQ